MRFLRQDDVPAAWIIDDLRDPPPDPHEPARLPVPSLDDAPSDDEVTEEPAPPRVMIIEI